MSDWMSLDCPEYGASDDNVPIPPMIGEVECETCHYRGPLERFMSEVLEE